MAAGCGHSTTVRYECPSPEGRWIAAYYASSGGGAAGWAFQYANVRRTGESFREEPWLAQLRASRDARLVWQDANHLRIDYPDSAQLDEKHDRVSEDVSIRVSYRAQPSGPKGFRDGIGGCGEWASKAAP